MSASAGSSQRGGHDRASGQEVTVGEGVSPRGDERPHRGHRAERGGQLIDGIAGVAARRQGGIGDEFGLAAGKIQVQRSAGGAAELQ